MAFRHKNMFWCRFRSLAVSMRGVAKVHWTEGGQGVYSMTFNEEVEYFNKKRWE